MITARTDTGKTTTCLKTLDKYPYSFCLGRSHDLVPGRPRAHLSEAADDQPSHGPGGEGPAAHARQRIGSSIQSRLHSRSGRRFAMVIAKTQLPAATINAIVQFLVPPPKYHVEKLVPDGEDRARGEARRA